MAYTNIDDPSAYFQTAIYTGAGSTVVAVTNDGNSDLQPDFLWFKRRDSAGGHALLDTSRGANVTSGFGPTGYSFVLNSNSTASEVADSTGVMTITSDGFTAKELTFAGGNTNTGSMVAWQWHCNGGTTSSNTDGDITSTVQVNSDAGFSIVTDSPSNNTARSIGHGLGVAPQVIIRRARNRVENWRVFHSAAGSTGALTLDNADAYNSSTVLFTGVTSTTFGVGTDFSVNGNYNYISYCFAEKQGYSKFGSYVGNGSADGPFVYTGFKPAWIMVKDTESSGDNWQILDTKRDPHNPQLKYLQADNASAEGSFTFVDILSNGFKFRSTYFVGPNVAGHKTIYMAFAENPFVTSTGIPTTAR